MTLHEETGSGVAGVPLRVGDGNGNAVGKPIYQYNGTEIVDAYLDDQLLLYYPFDGDVLDYSGNGNDGTDNSSAGFASARIGSDSKDFDGVDDWVDSNTNFTSSSPSGFSVSVWVLFDDLNGRHTFMASIDGNSDEFAFRSRDSSITFFTFDGNTAFGVLDVGSPFGNTGQWYHAVGTYDGSNGYTAYVDGGQVASSTDTTFVANNQDDGIGKRAGDNKHHHAGHLDDLRIYDRELSADEVDHLFQHGRVV